jgi:hypothetical protein
MANTRLPMRKIKEILRLASWKDGHSPKIEMTDVAFSMLAIAWFPL